MSRPTPPPPSLFAAQHQHQQPVAGPGPSTILTTAAALDLHLPTCASACSRVSGSTSDSGPVFYGESNILTMVAPRPSRGTDAVSGAPHARRPSLFHDVAKEMDARTPSVSCTAEAADRQSSLQAQLIARQGALDLPDALHCAPVIGAYFQWFHPCFPVLDRLDVARLYVSGRLSPLLLNAILFVGSSYCDVEPLCQMGYKDVGDAKANLYSKARVLLDADWETDKTVVLQSLFLMSFWRAPPLSVKNVRYWLGAAISLAQDYGFHRSYRDPSESPLQNILGLTAWQYQRHGSTS